MKAGSKVTRRRPALSRYPDGGDGHDGGGSQKTMRNAFHIQRTGGPLGRAFGFHIEIFRLSVSFNAGWYIAALRFRGVGFIQLANDPLQLDFYLSR